MKAIVVEYQNSKQEKPSPKNLLHSIFFENEFLGMNQWYELNKDQCFLIAEDFNDMEAVEKLLLAQADNNYVIKTQVVNVSFELKGIHVVIAPADLLRNKNVCWLNEQPRLDPEFIEAVKNKLLEKPTLSPSTSVKVQSNIKKHDSEKDTEDAPQGQAIKRSTFGSR